MNFFKKLFDWMLVIGLVLLLGRIITAVFLFLDIPFTTFFKDYSLISLVILIIGVIGLQVIKDKK
ncbi:hypothetical protein CIL05_18010 [Virgibacillus profundi]|uniref:Uncharacterized protein n=1 Tax=Virgibacillus profundi TaxID=2024555 RepID=A0A2A2I9K9_9BACI|nr:hypothetical protein [Virgibacillus profundi]PAV28262.1 hypothetical protein CIL05_18010 [Virgibacillus profundi]PXY52566.1 hypothetical protein CIT14_17450 [Virgibacillus profundi]